jgi:hypothetical protein
MFYSYDLVALTVKSKNAAEMVLSPFSVSESKREPETKSENTEKTHPG